MGRASAEKRIPVTEETWEKLGEMKRAGETYDELLEKLVEDYKKRRLFKRLDEIEGKSTFTPLEDV